MSDDKGFQLAFEKLCDEWGYSQTDFRKIIADGLSSDFTDDKTTDIKAALELYPAELQLLNSRADIKTVIETAQNFFASMHRKFQQISNTERESLIKYAINILKSTSSGNDYETHKRFRLTRNSQFCTASNGFEDGYYVIAAEPNIGKTAWLITLASDSLRSNDESQVLFYSLDDTKERIFERFTAALTRILRWDLSTPINRIGYVNPDLDKNANRICALQTITNLLDSKRLDILDAKDCRSLVDIQYDIKQKKDRAEKTAVFIDGVLRSTTPPFRSEFDKNEYRADTLDEIANTFALPLMTTNELQKNKDRKGEPVLDEIKGTGRFGYNAKMAIMMYAEDKKAFKKKTNPTVNLFIEKNKFSEHNFLMKYLMDYSQSLLSPKIEDEDDSIR